MADIKTRDAVKGTIKTIDKAAVASERMKSAYSKIKDKAEQGYYAEEGSATEYAADRVSAASERITNEGVHQFNKQGQKAVKTSRAVWKEVLAVYSVKTTTDPDNPQEVATMDDNKKQLLTDIFWEMNEISSRTESKTETVITETDDGHGNIVQSETTQTRTYLYIAVSHKTAEEMADQYGFDDEQRQMLSELLADENNSLWSQVLYGISVGDGEIVTVALSQVGNVGGQPYWSWYGFNSRVEWCACFVSWCANECGYIENGVIPKFAGCIQGSEWFMERGQWQDGSFTPEAGHIIFFDWEGDGLTDHVGIVERVENGTVYTVEGNSGDACRQNSYAVGSSVIYGYGIPAY